MFRAIIRTPRTLGKRRCASSTMGRRNSTVHRHFPVDGLYSDYDRLMNAYRTIIAGFTPDEQHRILHDNARRFYRL